MSTQGYLIIYHHFPNHKLLKANLVLFTIVTVSISNISGENPCLVALHIFTATLPLSVSVISLWQSVTRKATHIELHWRLIYIIKEILFINRLTSILIHDNCMLSWICLLVPVARCMLSYFTGCTIIICGLLYRESSCGLDQAITYPIITRQIRWVTWHTKAWTSNLDWTQVRIHMQVS